MGHLWDFAKERGKRLSTALSLETLSKQITS